MLNRLLLSLSVVVFVAGSALAQFPTVRRDTPYPPAYVNFEDYKNLVAKVESHRASRLISLDKFIEMSKQKGVIILDARSADRFSRRHVKGAVNLNFSDFTQDNLSRFVPDPNATILIYCNNNFDGDPVNLPTKVARPSPVSSVDNAEIMLALNIPTYINLYGYGYRNIYELSELVDIKDPRIKFEGSAVR